MKRLLVIAVIAFSAILAHSITAQAVGNGPDSAPVDMERVCLEYVDGTWTVCQLMVSEPASEDLPAGVKLVLDFGAGVLVGLLILAILWGMAQLLRGAFK